MNTLLALIIARLELLTAGQEFDDPTSESGGTMALSFHKGFLDPKRQGSSEADDINFVLARIMRGKESPREGRIVVRLVAGLHTNGDKDAGQADAELLLDLLLGITTQTSFTPFSLQPDVDWFFGDPDQGIQPHPKYYVTVDLPFKRAATATRRR